MEFFRSSFVSVLGTAESGNSGPSSAETIERLVERLRCANLLEDRRDNLVVYSIGTQLGNTEI